MKTKSFCQLSDCNWNGKWGSWSQDLSICIPDNHPKTRYLSIYLSISNRSIHIDLDPIQRRTTPQWRLVHSGHEEPPKKVATTQTSSLSQHRVARERGSIQNHTIPNFPNDISHRRERSMNTQTTIVRTWGKSAPPQDEGPKKMLTKRTWQLDKRGEHER